MRDKRFHGKIEEHEPFEERFMDVDKKIPGLAAMSDFITMEMSASQKRGEHQIYAVLHEILVHFGGVKMAIEKAKPIVSEEVAEILAQFEATA